MSREVDAAFDRLAPERPIGVSEALAAQGQPGRVLAEGEVDAAIASVLHCWLVEDQA